MPFLIDGLLKVSTRKLQKTPSHGKERYFVRNGSCNHPVFGYVRRLPSLQVGVDGGGLPGEKGGTSIIVSGGPDEITDEQWKPAIDDLRENVGENVAYDVHTHLIDIKGSTNQPSDTDKAHMVGNDPSYVLGYEARNHVEQVPNPVLGGQKASVTHTKSVSVYDKSGNVSKPFDYSVFKRSSQKINNEKD